MLARFFSWIRGITGRSVAEKEMAEEMEFHLAARADDLHRRGMTRQEAERAARLEFGAMESYKEQSRESRGLRWFDEVRADLRYAWRQMRQAPAFPAMAVAILAIGIGGSVAMFSALDAVMLRLLPVSNPEELKHFQWTSRKPGFHVSYDGSSTMNEAGERVEWSTSYPIYQYFRDRNTNFSRIFGFVSSSFRVGLTVDGHAHLTVANVVTGEYFPVLGTSPILGRTLGPEDDGSRGSSSVAVIGYGLWQRQFGGERSVLGKAVTVNGVPTVIVGVLPRGFCGVNPSRCAEIFLPMSMAGVAEDGTTAQHREELFRPDRWFLEVMGRLKPGVNPETARVEIETLLRQAILDYKPTREYEMPRVQLLPAGGGVGRFRNSLLPPLRILGWTVGVVLMIACANLAGLMLARAFARQREIGARLAMGAGRGRLIRQLLTESVLLAFLGGALGIWLAYLLGDSVIRLFVYGNDPVGVSGGINARALIFALGLSILTGVLFGLAPALRATRVDLLSALRITGATADSSRFRSGKVLIAVQVALSMILVAGSALFVRTLANLRSEALGFRPENLLMFQLNPILNGYKDERIANFHEDVLKRISDIPGVRSASMSRWGILSGSSTGDGIRIPGKGDLAIRTHFVAPRFPATNGIPLLMGRDVTFADRENSPKVAMINESLAKALFDSRNPLGETFDYGAAKIQVIGVVGDARYDSLRRAIPPTIYIPFRQFPQFSMTYVVRSETDPKALVSAVRRVVESVDTNVPMYEIKTQTEQINELLRRERMFATLLAIFAAIALGLACLGIFGTLAYLVGRRTPEIGVRMALGGKRSDIIFLILRESTMSVGIGVVVGIGAALVCGKLIESMLFGLRPRDPLTITVAGALLIATALLAGLIPALRASRISPVQALRHE